MTKQRIHKLLRIGISIIYLLLLTVPYSAVLYPGKEGLNDDGWQYVYVICDLELLLFFLPFAVCWFLYLFVSNGWLKKLLRIALLLLGVIYLFMSFSAMTVIAQDLQPGYGVLLAAALFPRLVVLFINDYNLGLQHRQRCDDASQKKIPLQYRSGNE
ncbi:MAG: hypothetical protein JNM19_16180 [Chitinophagaceae bacterium]|nr:hypothetical protein [Chitinophagaceae bacterium]